MRLSLSLVDDTLSPHVDRFFALPTRLERRNLPRLAECEGSSLLLLRGMAFAMSYLQTADLVFRLWRFVMIAYRREEVLEDLKVHFLAALFIVVAIALRASVLP